MPSKLVAFNHRTVGLFTHHRARTIANMRIKTFLYCRKLGFLANSFRLSERLHSSLHSCLRKRYKNCTAVIL